MPRRWINWLAAACALCCGLARAQQNSPQDGAALNQILERLSALERVNRSLEAEVQLLRQEVRALRAGPPAQPGQQAGPAEPAQATESATAAPTLEERVAVQERRVAEQAQSKVEAAQKMPLTLTGMVLFNIYANGRFNGNQQYPLFASAAAFPRTTGGTLRQTVLGVRFAWPTKLAGATVSGNLFTDFFAGSGDALDQVMRIRTGIVRLDWTRTTLIAGQDKPLVAPRDPDSLAQVAISPLTGAGNLWLWKPQVRLEQRLIDRTNTTLRAQVALFQTGEGFLQTVLDRNTVFPAGRPGWQGRLEWTRQWGENRRLELGGSFHASQSLALGQSAPSRIYSADWLAAPFGWLELKGSLWRGQNASPLGTLRQGVALVAPGVIRAVPSAGGWLQAGFKLTDRLSLNAITGQQDDQNRVLRNGAIGKNTAYIGNLIYRLGPNVIIALETGHMRTQYIGGAPRQNQHYDLAIGYLF